LVLEGKEGFAYDRKLIVGNPQPSNLAPISEKSTIYVHYLAGMEGTRSHLEPRG